jgi:hypothetical protein
MIVKPERVIARHRRGFRQDWASKRHRQQTWPSRSSEVMDLIRELRLANPDRGAALSRDF